MLNGALILNKPSGISSGIFSRKIKKFLRFKEKVGHAGTLDPLASGILIICIGQMTRFIHFLNLERKTYTAEISLGIKTNTGDLEGKIIEKTNNIPTTKDFEKTLGNFIGDISQKPPAYSSLKYKGKPYRYYAIRGIPIKIEERMVKIYDLKILSLKNDTLKIHVDCGSGTYIRSLAEDICESLNSYGAVSGLIRTKSAGYLIDDCLDLEEINKENIEKKIIKPGDALRGLDRIQCRSEIVDKITRGQIIETEMANKNGFFRFFDTEENFLGIVESYDGLLKPKRLLGNFNNNGDSS